MSEDWDAGEEGRHYKPKRVESSRGGGEPPKKVSEINIERLEEALSNAEMVRALGNLTKYVNNLSSDIQSLGKAIQSMKAGESDVLTEKFNKVSNQMERIQKILESYAKGRRAYNIDITALEKLSKKLGIDVRELLANKELLLTVGKAFGVMRYHPTEEEIVKLAKRMERYGITTLEGAKEMIIKIDTLLRIMGSFRSPYGLRDEELRNAIIFVTNTAIGKLLSGIERVASVEVKGEEFFAKPMREIRGEIGRLITSYMYASSIQRHLIERQIASLKDLYIAVGYIYRLVSGELKVKDLAELKNTQARVYKFIEKAVGREAMEKLMGKPPEEYVKPGELPPNIYANILKYITEASRISQTTSKIAREIDKFGGVFARTRRFGEELAGVFSRIKNVGYELGTAFIYMIPGIGQVVAIMSALSGAIDGVKKTIRAFSSILMPIVAFLAKRFGIGEGRELKIVSRIGGAVDRIFKFFTREGEEGKSFRQRLFSFLKMLMVAILTGKFIETVGETIKTGLLAGLGIKAGLIGGGLVGGLAGAKAGLAGALGGALGGTAGMALAVVGGLAVVGKIGEALGITEKGIRNMANVFEQNGSRIGRAGLEFTANLWAMGDSAKAWLTQNVPVIGGALGELAQGLIHGGAMVVMGASTVAGGIEFVGRKAYEGAQWLGGKITEGADWIRGRISEGWQGFTDWVGKNVYEPLRSAFSGARKWAEENVFNPLRNAFSNAGDWVRNNLIPSLKGIAEAILSGIARLFGLDPKKILEGLNKTAETVGNALSSFGSSVLGGLGSAIDSLKKLFGGNPTGLAGSVYYADQAMRGLIQSVNNASRSLEAIGSPALKGTDYSPYYKAMIDILVGLRNDIAYGFRELARTRQEVIISAQQSRVVRYG